MPTFLVLLSATTAGYFDLRWRRIPNWLVVSTLSVSLAWHAAQGGLAGLWASVAGLLGATAVLFPLFVMRGMGAGDVKFFGALGAAVTYRSVFGILFISLFVSGFMALFEVLRAGSMRHTATRIAELVGRWTRGRLGPHPVVNIDSSSAALIPFTLAVAIATWIFVLASRGVR